MTRFPAPDAGLRVVLTGAAGGIGQGMKKLFLSHPPLEDRIAALRAQQGTFA